MSTPQGTPPPDPGQPVPGAEPAPPPEAQQPTPQPTQQLPPYAQPYPQPGYPPAPPAPGYPPAAAAYPGQPYPAAPRTADAAIWSLVCAIGSWLLCPVVLAIVALVLARNADDAIDRSGGALTGRGLATAGRVLAWVHLAVVGLAVLFGLAVLVGVAVGAQ